MRKITFTLGVTKRAPLEDDRVRIERKVRTYHRSLLIRLVRLRSRINWKRQCDQSFRSKALEKMEHALRTGAA